MNMNSKIRVNRIIIATFIVAIFPLLIYQFVNAMPPQQDGGADEGLSMPPLSEGGEPIKPVFVEPREEHPFRNPNAINRDIEFDIYYGDVQNYGQIGNPQPWVDILGRVFPSDSGNGISSLTYSLNGGPDTPLSVGPDQRRLALKGDFHIELDINSLNDGANTVLIKATDNGGEQGQTTVTVNYDAGNSWPKNYTADWTGIVSHTDILDIAQVVDGAWIIENGELVPYYHVYDRMVAIGDQDTWDDYEVTVPITINGLNEDGFRPIPAGPGIGLILRWPGYFQKNSEQPRLGWENLGALAWNRWKENEDDEIVSGLQMLAYGGDEVGTNPDVQLEFGVTYMYKASVQSKIGGGAIYRFKVWKQGDPEPYEWHIIHDGDPDGPDSGSIVILAHYVDVNIGNVAVKPLSSINPSLTLNEQGNGTVSANPNKGSYDYGEVVEINANPDPGHELARWEGNLSGRDYPISFTLTSNASVTGVFVPENYVNLSVTNNGGGSVNVDPAAAQYLVGEVVTLEAIPDPGFEFIEWRQGHTGTDNPTSFIIEEATTVRAIFQEIPTYSITINPPVGEGSVEKDPDKGAYEEGEEVELTAVPEVGYVFSEWSGDLTGSDNPATITMNSNKSITPIFVEGQSYTLNVSAGPNGDVLIEPDKASYAVGEVVVLNALPDPGFMLGAWGGDLTGASSPSIVVMDANKSVSASFVPAVDPQSDDFNRCELDNGRWTTFDPKGDGTFTMTGTDLEISIPGGSSHDLWTDVDDAPKALTPAENANFEVEVKFNSDVNQSFQMQGILIRQNSENFLRFDFHHDGTNMRIFAAKFTNGAGQQTNNEVLAGAPKYMRVSRAGDNWSQFYSEDGLDWTLSKKFNHPLNVGEVGVFAGNAGGNPAFTTSIDYFFNTAMPIVPEDETEYKIDVTTNGNGSVVLSPDKENYTCGEVVQLTANPGADSNFIGWGGDLSGNSNPESLTISRDHAVTANFSSGSNLPPEFGIIPDQIGAVGTQMSFTVTATDPDGAGPPSLSVTNKPSTAIFNDNGDGSGLFTWTPTINDLGEHFVTFEASDGQLISSKTVKITVVEELSGLIYMPVVIRN